MCTSINLSSSWWIYGIRRCVSHSLHPITTLRTSCSHYTKVFKIYNLTDEEATLIEPAACAVHGADKLALPVGAEVLILGAGPTGLILSQILKMNGASKVVLAANKGIKTRIAQEINAADVYVEIDRENPQADWDRIKKEYPYGFDAVVRFVLRLLKITLMLAG